MKKFPALLPHKNLFNLFIFYETYTNGVVITYVSILLLSLDEDGIVVLRFA